MKHKLLRVLTSTFYTLTITVLLLFLNVFKGQGTNISCSIPFGLSFQQVKPSGKDSILTSKDKSQSSNKTYRVQVCALNHKIADLSGLENATGQKTLSEEEDGGYIKYLTSAFTSYGEVLKAWKEIKARPGYEGSFVVVYHDGVRVKHNMYVAKVNPQISPVKAEPVETVKPKIKKDQDFEYTESDSAKKTAIETLPKTKAVVADTLNPKVTKTEHINKSTGIVSGTTTGHFALNLKEVILISLVSCVLLLIAFLAIYRYTLKIKERKAIRFQELYADKLAEYWSDQTEKLTVPELFTEANTTFKKDLLISEMISLLDTLEVGAENKIRDLYFKLELHFYSYQKLSNRKWTVQAMGIHELAAMDVRNEVDSIEEFLNHPNPILRHDAISALVRLRPDDAFSFLDRFKTNITKHDQINIQAIIKKHNIAYPDFSCWFDSYNPSVVRFAIEMVSATGQTEAIGEFDKLLHHSYEEVRMSVIKAIGEMHLNTYSTRLIPIFNDEHEQIQLMILQTMEKLEDVMLLNFLSDLVLLNPSMKIGLQAAKALIHIGPQGLARMQTLLLNNDNDIRYIYDQLMS